MYSPIIAVKLTNSSYKEYLDVFYKIFHYYKEYYGDITSFHHYINDNNLVNEIPYEDIALMMSDASLTCILNKLSTNTLNILNNFRKDNYISHKSMPILSDTSINFICKHDSINLSECENYIIFHIQLSEPIEHSLRYSNFVNFIKDVFLSHYNKELFDFINIRNEISGNKNVIFWYYELLHGRKIYAKEIISNYLIKQRKVLLNNNDFIFISSFKEKNEIMREQWKEILIILRDDKNFRKLLKQENKSFALFKILSDFGNALGTF